MRHIFTKVQEMRTLNIVLFVSMASAILNIIICFISMGAQWLSGRALDSRPKVRWFEPHRRHCIMSLSKTQFNTCLLLVQPRKTRPVITEKLLTGT